MELPKQFDNITQRVIDDLKTTLRRGSKVSMAAASFSIYAFEALQKELEQVGELRFIFTSPTFNKERAKMQKREFYIPKLNRERTLYGSDFEIKLRNNLTQRAIAKECADWIRQKVRFKTNVSQMQMPGLFTFIDIHMPHHIVFVLVHDESAMLLINYKDWADGTHTKFKITQAFASPWGPLSEVELTVQGQSLPRIYDNFVAQISGIGEHKAGALEEIVELKAKIAKAESELESLQKKMRREPQFDRQLAINKQVKAKRQELSELKKQLKELSV